MTFSLVPIPFNFVLPFYSFLGRSAPSFTRSSPISFSLSLSFLSILPIFIKIVPRTSKKLVYNLGHRCVVSRGHWWDALWQQQDQNGCYCLKNTEWLHQLRPRWFLLIQLIHFLNAFLTHSASLTGSILARVLRLHCPAIYIRVWNCILSHSFKLWNLQNISYYRIDRYAELCFTIVGTLAKLKCKFMDL